MDWKSIWDHEAELPKGVSIVRPTPQWLNAAWNRVRHRDLLFPDEAPSREHFFRSAANSLILTSGPAVLRISGVVPYTRCVMHGYVLDAAITPLGDLFQRTLKWVFRVLEVERVECFIPEGTRALARFLVSNGFAFEGCLRNRRKYLGRACSEEVYSILKEEL